MSVLLPWYRAVAVAGVVLALAGGALATVSVATRHDVAVGRPSVAVAPAAPAPDSPTTIPAPDTSPPLAPSTGAGAGRAGTRVSTTGSPAAGPTPTPVAAPASGPAAPPAPPPDPVTRVELSCPLPLAPSTTPGGLASLATLIPLLGPFAPEAFAWVPVLQPLFPLVAPLLNQGQLVLTQSQPLIDQAVPIVQLVQNAGFLTLQPAYAPFRPQFLEAVKQIATSLQPIVGSVAGLPGAGCLPALQSALLSIAGA